MIHYSSSIFTHIPFQLSTLQFPWVVEPEPRFSIRSSNAAFDAVEWVNEWFSLPILNLLSTLTPTLSRQGRGGRMVLGVGRGGEDYTNFQIFFMKF
jgi:hypothetical protein